MHRLKSDGRRRNVLLVAIAATALLAFPSIASAWTVTVHVHGAGKVDETPGTGTTHRNLMNCTTPSNVSDSTGSFDCVAGSQDGLYHSTDTVNLQAQVPDAYYARGWRFLRWVDSNAGGGQINCDPQDQSGPHTNIDCQFQIFENLETNLYFDDIHGPNLTDVYSGPASPTKSTSADFSFNASDDPDARFDCRLDSPGSAGSYYQCGSSSDKSETYTGLADGAYTLYVRGRDPSGNVDPSPDSWSWTVDTVAPTVSINGGPADGSTTTNPNATFSVSSTEGLTPTCTLDGALTPCGTAKTGLAPGSHTFAAQATDGADNTGSASRTWTVASPNTTITSGPGEGAITGATVEFGFTASPAADCRIDEGAWSPCSSPFQVTLPGGAHTFRVRANHSGNVDPTPATRTFIVDADGDGSIVPQDCNDTDSSRHPGATDTPGDGIDQDCSGADASTTNTTNTTNTTTTTGGGTDGGTQPGGTNPLVPPGPNLPQAAAMPAAVTHTLALRRRGTIFRRLAVVNLPAGSTVSVRCTGASCPKRSFSKAASPQLVLKPFMAKLLRARTRLTITISAPGYVTEVVTYVIRAGKKPTVTVA